MMILAIITQRIIPTLTQTPITIGIFVSSTFGRFDIDSDVGFVVDCKGGDDDLVAVVTVVVVFVDTVVDDLLVLLRRGVTSG